MKRSTFVKLVVLAGVAVFANKPSTATAAEASSRCYELRIYYAADGKLNELNKRFKDHTVGLFKRHGMTNLAYWMPLENQQRRLIYLLSYPDLAARNASWEAFKADPEWSRVQSASEAAGKLVERVESRMLTATDFSPEMKVDPAGAPHTFEMRTYTATPGNLDKLLERFRKHTVSLFSKHGMQHFGYFTLSAGQTGDSDTLIYFLVHKSAEAQANSFAQFRADPEWIDIKAKSEVRGGGSLTVPDGVKSELLRATDYSPVQ
jgi:NIPSNAP